MVGIKDANVNLLGLPQADNLSKGDTWEGPWGGRAKRERERTEILHDIMGMDPALPETIPSHHRFLSHARQ